MLVTFIFNDLLWPDLDFGLFKHDLCIHAVPLLDISILDRFELFAAGLTDVMVQIVKREFFTFDLILTLHVTLSLKCLAWISCVSMRIFDYRLARLAAINSLGDSPGDAERPPGQWRSAETPVKRGLKRMYTRSFFLFCMVVHSLLPVVGCSVARSGVRERALYGSLEEVEGVRRSEVCHSRAMVSRWLQKGNC